MIIRPAVLFAITSLGMTLCVSAQGPKAGQIVPTYYELYSWQESGTWSFCVLPSPSGVNISAEQVFSKECRINGVESLKRKMFTLPEGSTMLWLARITGASWDTKDSKRLRYPSSEAVQEIRKCAESRKIKLEIPSGREHTEAIPRVFELGGSAAPTGLSFFSDSCPALKALG